MAGRTFYPHALNHCYQCTADHGVLFYDVCDRLLFFTVFCVMARRHKVKVYKLVLMPDHIHHSTVPRSKEQLSSFARDYSAVFAREYNGAFGRKGPVFQAPFQFAPKRGDKSIRTHLLYLDNNPVERKLVTQAELYRWNFLAYGDSTHPFSEAIVLRHASMPLRRALQRVDWECGQNHDLSYRLLRNLFDSLPEDRERNQLTDYIINKYSVMDHAAAFRFFGGFEQEIQAAHFTTGSEYDINEGFIGKSDRYYSLFSKILRQEAGLTDNHAPLTAPEAHKWEWFNLLRRKTDAPAKQIAAYLHVRVETKH